MIRRLLVCGATGLVILGACADGEKKAESPATTAAATADANTASQAELLAALNARNVPDALRWVQEIEKYRPYPKGDPSLQKLRANLEQFDLGDQVVRRIVASLHV
jgi:hypothetical protein